MYSIYSQGSGKTLAFGLPILAQLLSHRERLTDSKEHSVFALVLEPTRELAVQVARHLRAAARFTDIRVQFLDYAFTY